MKTAKRPQKPRLTTPARISVAASETLVARWATLPNVPTRMEMPCVIRKTRKIGISTQIDSFTPRMFMTIRIASPRKQAGTLAAWYSDGRRLKVASAPLAIDTEIVRM